EHLADLHPRGLAELVSEAEEAAAAHGSAAGLRRFRRRATSRVAARDLAGATVDEVMQALSFIAEACLEVAVRTEAGIGLVVIGMGKLGGEELNYSSDVDVLFVHRGAGGDEQERHSRGAATLLRLMGEPTEDGIVLRVDPTLRPEGRAGPLSRSLPSMVAYYREHAATRERQALLKARVVAGDRQAGTEFLAAIRPYLYPAVLPASAIED